MRAVEAYHVQAMIAAPEGPKGSDVRDHHHRMLSAVREVAVELLARAASADEIERNAAAPADDEEDTL